VLAGLCCALSPAGCGSKATIGPRPDPDAERVPVLVAKQDIRSGTWIKDPAEFFHTVHYPKGEEPADALRASSQLVRKWTVRPMLEGEPVRDYDLADQEPTQLGERERGMTIPVPEADRISSLVPGCRLDILVSRSVAGTDKDLLEPFLHNVLVLAISGKRQAATLVVTESEAVQLAEARARGKLKLVVVAPPSLR
jgi:Flp pilus assembly protein CpaB